MMLARFPLIVFVVMLLASPFSHAHKVIFDVFPGVDVIEGELGFSNGDMAVEENIVVLDVNGQAVAEVMTDGDGFFVYTPTQATALVFKADLGAGHVAEVALSAAQVADVMGVAAVATPVPNAVSVAANQPKPNTDQQAVVDQLARLSSDLKQLRKEIKHYKEKNDMQTVLGGIGYIFGLFGVAFYMAARRKLAAK